MATKHMILGALALGLVMAGCGPSDSGTSSGGTAGTAGGTTSGPAGGTTPTGEKQTLTVKGSDTMVQLAQTWAQDFMKVHPEISVTVTGGGSNVGIAALMNKGTDIADASRPMKKEEMDSAKQSGLDVKEFVVGQDALSIIVNKSNPVKDLTLAQLKDIYTGKVTNWKQIGGPDSKIVATGRESSSGSYTFFNEHVLNKEKFAATVMSNPGTSQIVESVAADAGAIGYVGLGYVNDTVKAVPIKKDATAPAVLGSSATVLDRSYPLARPLFEYTGGEPTGASKVWLDWVMGPEGQAIVDKMGFVKVK